MKIMIGWITAYRARGRRAQLASLCFLNPAQPSPGSIADTGRDLGADGEQGALSLSIMDTVDQGRMESGRALDSEGGGIASCH